MNVITGVFVESALATSQADRDMHMVHHVREIFQRADQDGSGKLSWEEFQAALPTMIDYFKAVDIDITEAEHLFTLLDMEETGSVLLEEFVMGCFRLRGPAKSMDLVMMMYESRRQHRTWKRHASKMDRFLNSIYKRLVRLEQVDVREPSSSIGALHFSTP